MRKTLRVTDFHLFYLNVSLLCCFISQTGICYHFVSIHHNPKHTFLVQIVLLFNALCYSPSHLHFSCPMNQKSCTFKENSLRWKSYKNVDCRTIKVRFRCWALCYIKVCVIHYTILPSWMNSHVDYVCVLMLSAFQRDPDASLWSQYQFAHWPEFLPLLTCHYVKVAQNRSENNLFLHYSKTLTWIHKHKTVSYYKKINKKKNLEEYRMTHYFHV